MTATAIPGATPNRPMAFADDAASATGSQAAGEELTMEPTNLAVFWAGVIAVLDPAST